MRRILLITIALSVWMWADAVRYTRSDAGIVTDNKTGLQWQDYYSDNGDTVKSASGDTAATYCSNLVLGGHSDWRLPTIDELMYIADRSRRNPAIDSTFKKARSDLYWSSTSVVGDEGLAWYVYFDGGGGGDGWGGKSNSYYVRCVRAGE